MERNRIGIVNLKDFQMKIDKHEHDRMINKDKEEIISSHFVVRTHEARNGIIVCH